MFEQPKDELVPKTDNSPTTGTYIYILYSFEPLSNETL